MAIHRLFVLSTGDWWAIRSITRPFKGDSSAIRPKHGRLVGDSSSHTADQKRFVLSTGDWWAIRPSHGRSKAIHRRFVLSTGDWWAIRSLTLPVKGDSSLNLALNLQVLTRKLPLANRPRHVVSENESPVFRTNRLQNRLQNRIHNRYRTHTEPPSELPSETSSEHEQTRTNTNTNKHEQTRTNMTMNKHEQEQT